MRECVCKQRHLFSIKLIPGYSDLSVGVGVKKEDIAMSLCVCLKVRVFVVYPTLTTWRPRVK